jgi:hypothetical protein
MRRARSPEEVIESWTLLGTDWTLVGNKSDATRRCAQVVCSGHAFVQNLRRGHYELGLDTEPCRRLAVVFTELALAI